MGKQLVVLVSGTGSNLQALLDHGALGGQITRVVADRPGAGGLERARRHGVDAVAVAPGDHADRKTWEAALVAAVAEAAPDLVVLAGFMRILSPAFVNRWPILNVHPSLLPSFPGARAVTDALEWGVKLSGVTVHFVDEEVDHGPIVAQEGVGVLPDDTPATLHERIQAVEHRLLPECVSLFCHDRLAIDGRQVRILP